ncbi:MAG: hypothetical protein IJ146_09540 [Kiritimatiellae bacterium]|nr:hypothetical protein [Kiritimatiellia bacterium]
MRINVCSMTVVALALAAASAFAGGLGFPQPGAEKTLRADFKAPPRGYGEVPFWWWSGGDKLDKERMLEQLEELHKAGIPGVQVNYAHRRMDGWPTQDTDPSLFTEEWWDVFGFVARECAKRKMGISLSNYTLDFPERKNLWTRLGICCPEMRARELRMATKSFDGGKVPDFGADVVAVIASQDAFPGRVVQPGGELPAGKWRLYVVSAPQCVKTLDPLNPESGKRVVDRFFNAFLENVPEEARGALNYFFQDELMLTGDILWLWSPDYADEFKKRKDYDILPLLPALFTDWGPDTVKVRLDMNDVMSAIACERYYEPIYNWHASRRLIYGCDQATRGKHPMNQYIDYMRVMKYFTAPGFDTPGRSADIIKNKVGSSIAHLNRRPRVWLEGYHSQGWQASTTTIFDSTTHNYLYGSNLLNLHGFYYTTRGGWWEWAPPCYHFRMPYWTYMKTFLKYFERLSYILSQGEHVCDVAVVNALEPCVYNRHRGNVSVGVSHDIVCRLVTEAQTDVDFIDADSIARAEVKDARLCVADEAFRMVILPDMVAIRSSSLAKLAEFKRAGGIVVILGETPKFTDAFHKDKAKIDTMVAELSTGRTGILPVALPAKPNAAQLKAIADSVGTPDFRGPGNAKALHRRIGGYDVYFVCDLKEPGECTFRTSGTPELWNPWDGSQKTLSKFKRNANGTTVVHIEGDGAPKLVVFSKEMPGRTGIMPVQGDGTARTGVSPVCLDGEWDFTLKPTMDNKWGDYRLPVRKRFIGAEVRRVNMTGARELNLPARMTVDFGPRFREYGPYPAETDVSAIEAQLVAQKPQDLAPTSSAAAPAWRPFAFSWREGAEGRPAFQDAHHGLSGSVGDDFFVLGPYNIGMYSVVPPRGWKPQTYLYQTAVYAPCDCTAKAVVNGVAPQKLWIDGAERKADEEVKLAAGWHMLLARYVECGRAALVMMRTDMESVPSKTPLSMRWFEDPAVLQCDCFAGAVREGIYTATLPPACEEIEMRVRGKVLAAAIAGATAEVKFVEKCTTGVNVYCVKPSMPWKGIAMLTLKIAHEPGFIGGAVFAEPMSLKCGKGRIALGNWALLADGLECYSGGAVYEKLFTLSAEQAKSACVLDLGGVGACCGVSLNGGEEKVVCCPPWRVDIGGMTKEGENTLKITVYNTLNNHYQTIPTRYRTTVENAPSGLLGPVKVMFSRNAK